MHHGSRHRRSDSGRGRHEQSQDRSRSGSRAAKAVGATVAVSLVAGVSAVVMAGAAGDKDPGTSLAASAVEDTYVYQEFPNTNRGADAKLTAANETTLHTRAYLKFDVTGVPAGATAGKASLRLSSDRNQPELVELHRVASTSWRQATTTMTNAPAMGETVAVARPAPKQKYLDFDLSGVVTGNGVYSFALVSPQAGTTAAVYASEHGVDGPTLNLDWGGGAPAPAPGRPAPTTSAPGLPGLPSMSPVKPAPTSPSTPAPTSSAPGTAPAPGPVQPAGSTMFGSSLWVGDGSSTAGALARTQAKFGQLDMVRTYYSGLPQAWPGSAGITGGPVSVSFKAMPRDVLSGSQDAAISRWFQTAPTNRTIWWTYYHEPEDDIERGAFTAADYRAAWQHVAALADRAGKPNLRSTLILMCYSLNSYSKRNWQDYYPGAAAIDVLGWDCYNRGVAKGQYFSAAQVLGPVVAAAKSVGKPWGVGELGTKLIPGDSGAGRAAWLRDVGAYSRQNGAQFVAYFDSTVGDDYRLLDGPSQQAWREVVAG